MPSFDVVNKVDMQEVLNTVNNASKEILQRYDFKGSKQNWSGTARTAGSSSARRMK